VDLKCFGNDTEVCKILKKYVEDENNFKIGRPSKFDDGY
jgi:hypothetical protein